MASTENPRAGSLRCDQTLPLLATPSLTQMAVSAATRAALLVLAAGPRPARAVGPHNCGADDIPADARPTDCAWRSLAVQYATQIAGNHVGPSVHDALEIGRLCPKDSAARPEPVAKPHAEGAWTDAQVVLHVSATADGSGDGSAARPLTLLQARDKVRSVGQRDRPATTVMLGGGKYYLNGSTLELGPQDGGRSEDASVVWAAAAGETPVISGAVPLVGLHWSKYDVRPGAWVADLPPETPAFKSLYVGGERYWPARWPNGDPRFNLFPDSYSTDCTWGDDMSEADGVSFEGGKLTDLCADPGSQSAGVPCHRNLTHFPDSPWYSHPATFVAGYLCSWVPS
jgi:hypothetical protein